MQGAYQKLKARQRAEWGDHPENLGLRVHQALIWLGRAEREGDPHSLSILLWIFFEAAYLLRATSFISNSLQLRPQYPVSDISG